MERASPKSSEVAVTIRKVHIYIHGERAGVDEWSAA